MSGRSRSFYLSIRIVEQTVNLKIKIYIIIMLLLVVNGCGTWSLTLRKERRLWVFENRVLRIFGHKRDEVTGEWRKLVMRSFMLCTPHSILCG
jgi:hypothetical protein